MSKKISPRLNLDKGVLIVANMKLLISVSILVFVLSMAHYNEPLIASWSSSAIISCLSFHIFVSVLLIQARLTVSSKRNAKCWFANNFSLLSASAKANFAISRRRWICNAWIPMLNCHQLGEYFIQQLSFALQLNCSSPCSNMDASVSVLYYSASILEAHFSWKSKTWDDFTNLFNFSIENVWLWKVCEQTWPSIQSSLCWKKWR